MASDFVLTGASGRYPLGQALSYLEDKDDRIDLSQALAQLQNGAFKVNAKEVANFGFTRSAYWFHVRLRNEATPDQHWLLENGYPLLDRINVYFLRDGKLVDKQLSGDVLPFSERFVKNHNMIFDVNLAQDESIDILIRVKTESSLQLPLTLWSAKELYAKDHEEQLFLGLYYGILLALLLYNAMIFLSIRDINYLYYVHYIFGYGIFQMVVNGLAFEYLWPNSPRWGNNATPFFIGFCMFAMLNFSSAFLQLKQNLPRLEIVFKGLRIVFALVSVGALVLPYSLVTQVGTLAAVISPVLVFIAALICWLNRFKPAKFFLLAWTVFLAGITMYALKTFGILPNIFLTEYGLQIGSAMEAILLSFALAHRMAILKEENEGLQREANELLEIRVEQRTVDLNHALDKLSVANEQLKNMNMVDGLTGAKNRKFFDEAFAQEYNRSRRNASPLGFMMLDIDHFKLVNDTYGHQIGDTCLKQVTHIIMEQMRRPGDEVVRYGGEEFAVISPNTTEAGIAYLADAIRRAVEELEIVHELQHLKVTISIGAVVETTFEDETCDDLIARADAALYRAKHQGRNQVCFGLSGTVSKSDRD